MAQVLLVSKPLAPPWNDSGKNLVRDVARGLRRYRATVMVRTGDDPDVGGSARRAVYPALADQARVLAHLVMSRRHDLWHFFFAPNPRSCRAGWAATRLRAMPSVHTVSSAPRDPRAVVPLLFAEVNVVLSRHTEERLLDAGLAADRLSRIAPAIEPLAPKSDAARLSLRAELGLPRDAPLVVYPGDLEFGEGGALMIEAQRLFSRRGIRLVMACRAKTARAREAELALRETARKYGLGESVLWLGETPRIHDLLATADVVALPSADLYAKMDYPLVLLEAMSLERPVIVASGGAAAELSEGGAALAVEPRAEALAHALASLLEDRKRATHLGEAGARAVRERYAYRTMAGAYEDVYDRVLG